MRQSGMFLVVGMVFLVACGAGTRSNQPPNSAANSSTSEFVYVLVRDYSSGTDNPPASIVGIMFDANGQASAIPGAPISVAPSSSHMLVVGDLLFLSSYGPVYGSQPSGYRIDTFRIDLHTGALTQIASLNPSEIGLVGAPFALVADPSQRFLYVHLANSDAPIAAFSIDRIGGVLTQIPGSPFFFPGNGGDSMAISPDGALICGLGCGKGCAPVFACAHRNVTTGAIATDFSGAYLEGGADVSFSPDGRYLLIAAGQADSVIVLSVDAQGGLTYVSGSPFPTGGANAAAFAFTRDGKYVAVANEFSANVSLMHFDGSSGTVSPTAESLFAAGEWPFRLCFSSSGEFLFVINNGSKNLSAYRANSTGTLTSLAGSPFDLHFSPVDVATVPQAQ